eukprot:6992709-Pyramimonas_sp.AAC.1
MHLDSVPRKRVQEIGKNICGTLNLLPAFVEGLSTGGVFINSSAYIYKGLSKMRAGLLLPRKALN